MNATPFKRFLSKEITNLADAFGFGSSEPCSWLDLSGS